MKLQENKEQSMTAVYVAILKNTARQIWRRRAFWVIQGLLSIPPVLLTALVFLVEPGAQIGMGMTVPGLVTLGLNYLLLPILVARPILDDFGKVGDILWSGPLDKLVHFAGQFSGLWLALLTGSLMQLGGWFLASLLWSSLPTGWLWLFSLAVYLLANTLGLCFVFLLAVVLRRTLPVLLGWSVLWVWLYYQVVFSEAMEEGFNPMNTTGAFNIFFHNLRFSPSLGLGLAQGYVLGLFTWFLGLSLAALALALLLTRLADSRRATRLGWFAPLAVCMAVFAAAAGYAVNANAVAAHALPPSPLDVQVDVWEVLRQHTEVEVNAEDGFISGTAVFELAPAPGAELERPEIVLRLNAGLELTAASAAGGQALTAHRVGDSVVIGLPEGSDLQAPLTLNLAWQGRLQIPYAAFDQGWSWSFAPYPSNYTYMPQALMAFIQPTGGYLLRDGDWMPWPWSTGPHQARQNTLELRPQSAEAVAAMPIQNGAVSWEGPLPKALLVFLPGRRIETGAATLAASPSLAPRRLEQARLFALAAERLAAVFQTPPPRYVVVTPYLYDLLWSGDLLLVPDGSGYYMAQPVWWLYQQDMSGPQQPFIARATLATLARAYLLDRLTPPGLEIRPLLSPAGQNTHLAEGGSFSAQDWAADNGHWVQVPEIFDTITTWDPHRLITLNAQGEWSAVAFWLAMELSEEPARQADLEALNFIEEGTQEITDDIEWVAQRYDLVIKERYDLMNKLILPELVDSSRGRAIIFSLHQWAERFGSEEAIALFAAVIQEARPGTVDQLFAELEQRSGMSIREEQP